MKTRKLFQLAVVTAAAWCNGLLFAQFQPVDNWQTLASLRLVEEWGAGGWKLAVAGNEVYGVGYGYFTATESAALIIKRDEVNGWVLVDEAITGGNGTGYNAFLADPSTPARLYAGGRIGPYDTASWIIRQSDDGGQTWTTTDLFAPGPNSLCSELAVDEHGHVYAAGQYGESSSTGVVRKSTDFGASWQTIDTFPGIARAAAYHPVTKTLFVGGINNSGGSGKNIIPQWSIRRSADGGLTWTTVGGFAPKGTKAAMIQSVHAHGAATIYAAGYIRVSEGNKSPWYWLVRRSTDNGQTWSTIDMFAEDSKNWKAQSVAVDFAGTEFVIGTDNQNWLVKKRSIDASAWEVSDLFAAGEAARSIVVDASGNLLTTGFARRTDDGRPHWVIRGLVPSAVFILSGNVADAETTMAIAGATVSVGGTGLAAVTDGNGDYVIQGVPEGDRTVTASAAGYAAVTQAFSVSGDATVNFELEPLAPAYEVGVRSITYSTSGGKHNDQNIEITIEAGNDWDEAVAALITLTVYRNESVYQTGTITSGEDGVARVVLQKAPKGTYISLVNNVVADGLEWDGITPPNEFTK
jgi:hypothetical protein